MLLHFFVVLIASALLTGLIRYYALKRKVLDIPNQRSSHTTPTPRGGGLAIVLVFFLACLFLLFTQQLDTARFFALNAPLLVAAIGFYDDHAPVAARWRFLIHIISALLALLFINGMPAIVIPFPSSELVLNLGLVAYLLGMLLLVWQLNLFNFMDGTDGIAASEALFVSLAIAGFVYSLDQTLFTVCVCLAAGCLGFLCWNWPKAKIFMGDVGSGFIGFLLGLLILMAAKLDAILFWCGLIVFGLFMVDATYTLLTRILTGQKWYDAHCSHTYQKLAKRYGHLRVLQFSWLINCLWLLPVSIAVFFYPNFALVGLIVAYLPLFFIAYRCKAGLID